MIRHTQTILADPARGDGHDAEGRAGDCVRTCVASIFEVADLNRVPNFADEGGEWKWFLAMRLWARERDLDFGGASTSFPVFPVPVDGPQRYALVSGPSPRGDFLHMVIADSVTGEILHDPHPSRDGLAGPISDVIAVTSPYPLDGLLEVMAVSE